MNGISKEIGTVIEKIRMMSEELHGDPTRVEILAATKYVEPLVLGELIAAGINLFGENRVQSFLPKWEKMQETGGSGNCDPEKACYPKFDFIGNLQRNKMRKLWGKIRLYHGFDRLSLLPAFEKLSAESGNRASVLLELKWDEESEKHGFLPEQVEDLVPEFHYATGINVEGLMVMAPFTDNISRIAKCFSESRMLFEKLKEFESSNFKMTTLSMGMSGDYEIAIKEGSTLVRLGRILFN